MLTLSQLTQSDASERSNCPVVSSGGFSAETHQIRTIVERTRTDEESSPPPASLQTYNHLKLQDYKNIPKRTTPPPLLC